MAKTLRWVILGCLIGSGCSHPQLKNDSFQTSFCPSEFAVSDDPLRLGTDYTVGLWRKRKKKLTLYRIQVPSPVGYDEQVAMVIPRVELVIENEPSSGKTQRISSLKIVDPKVVIDWNACGCNLDVLHYMLVRALRRHRVADDNRWQLGQLSVEGGSINAKDAWLGRERIDIPIESFDVQGESFQDQELSTQELVELCVKYIVHAVHRSVSDFDEEMRDLDLAVEEELQQYFSN